MSMSLQLPQPIERYVKAENSGDTEALSACFATDAAVRDEGHTYVGLDAIKNWKADAKKRYNHTIHCSLSATVKARQSLRLG